MTPRVRITTAIFLIVAAWATAVAVLVPFPPVADSTLPSAAGKAIAGQTISLAKPGSPVFILTPDTQEFPRPAFDVLCRSLEKELRSAHVPISGVRKFELDPLRPVEVPAGDFLEMLRRAPSNTVIVSLLGPPLLSDGQRKEVGKAHPRVVAFCSGSTPTRADLAELCEEGFLDAAVVAIQPAQLGAKPEPLFSNRYEVLTSTNASAWLRRKL